MDLSPKALASRIDHTHLKPDATHETIESLCSEAESFGFATVCVNPRWVPLCARRLVNQPVAVCSVVGFPLGASRTPIKVDEARLAVEDGADEIDMVLDVGSLLEADTARVREDIEAVVDAVAGRVVKVILETSLLTEEAKRRACHAAREAGAHFVKTSTGFGGGGATVADVRLMRSVVRDGMRIKASGGIRDYATAVAMVEAGADRLGCSASVAIVSERS